MTTMLVIDARTREMKTFVASVTKVESSKRELQLVLRFAMEAPEVESLPEMMELPILIMGSYRAKSSGGFTAASRTLAYGENKFHHREAVVVGRFCSRLATGFPTPVAFAQNLRL